LGPRQEGMVYREVYICSHGTLEHANDGLWIERRLSWSTVSSEKTPARALCIIASR
jgi:hypothetical protein